jgi:hypothetical protein
MVCYRMSRKGRHCRLATLLLLRANKNLVLKRITALRTFSALIAMFGYQAQNQATAKPDKASIELWLNNRLIQHLNVRV